jgi:hypothetical protein
LYKIFYIGKAPPNTKSLVKNLQVNKKNSPSLYSNFFYVQEHKALGTYYLYEKQALKPGLDPGLDPDPEPILLGKHRQLASAPFLAV